MGNCCENPTIPNANDFPAVVDSEFPKTTGLQQERQKLAHSDLDVQAEEITGEVNALVVGDDSKYSGLMNKGKANGQGRLENPRLAYEGEFVNGRPNGRGTLVMANGDTFMGEFVNGSLHGKGSFKSQSGFLYEGQFQGNRFHGLGRAVWPDGSSYEGEFSMGRQHGEGVFIYKDRRVFRGKYVNGKKDGQGTISFPNKADLIKSTWREDAMVGPSFLVMKGQEIKIDLTSESGIPVAVRN